MQLLWMRRPDGLQQGLEQIFVVGELLYSSLDGNLATKVTTRIEMAIMFGTGTQTCLARGGRS